MRTASSSRSSTSNKEKSESTTSQSPPEEADGKSESKLQARNSSSNNNTPLSNLLPALFKSLAKGVRCTNSLPLKKQSNNNSDSDHDDSDDDEDDDDEYAYQMAFPQYRKVHAAAKSSLLQVASSATRAIDHNINEDVNEDELDAEEVWEKCAETTEELMEEVNRYLAHVHKKQDLTSNADTGKKNELKNDSWNVAKERQSLFPKWRNGGIAGMTADIEKSQITYNFAQDIENSRTIPFIPRPLQPKPYAIGDTNQHLKPLPGHGITVPRYILQTLNLQDTLHTTNQPQQQQQQQDKPQVEIVAPSEHYPHPYQQEIQSLTYPPWQFHPPPPFQKWSDPECLPPSGVGGTLNAKQQAKQQQEEEAQGPKSRFQRHNKKPLKSKLQLEPEQLASQSPFANAPPCTWIDTEMELERFVQEVVVKNLVREVAVDLEAHSYRSFMGFVCLMQLSVRWWEEEEENDKTEGDLKEDDNGSNDTNKVKDNKDKKTKKKTIHTKDVLIDTLPLRSSLQTHLAPLFANPQIVKVMHGADSDILWLQRDFQIYTVNLFDTYRAAKALHYPRLGLAVLLKKHAGVEVDKKYQLADWRVRPLKEEMVEYARSDVHYLLDVYDAMRRELVDRAAGDTGVGVQVKEKNTENMKDVAMVDVSTDDNNNSLTKSKDPTSTQDDKKEDSPPPPTIYTVLQESQKVCLQRCSTEPFYPQGWQKLLMSKRATYSPNENISRKRQAPSSKNHDDTTNHDQNHNKNTNKFSSYWTMERRTCLAQLYDWRDATARALDESLAFICPNAALMKIASQLPSSVRALTDLLHPMPYGVGRNVEEVLQCVVKAREMVQEKEGEVKGEEGGGGDGSSGSGDELKTVAKSETTKPIASTVSENRTSHLEQDDMSTSSDSDNDETQKPRKKQRIASFLLTDKSVNLSFQSDVGTAHSLSMGPFVTNREVNGVSTDVEWRFVEKKNRRGVTVDGLGAIRLALSKKDGDAGNQDGNDDASTKMTREAVSAAPQDQAAFEVQRARLITSRIWNRLREEYSCPVASMNSDEESGDEPETMAMEETEVDSSLQEEKEKEAAKSETDDKEEVNATKEGDLPPSLRASHGIRKSNKKKRRRQIGLMSEGETSASSTTPSKSASSTTPSKSASSSTVGLLTGLSATSIGNNPFFSGAALEPPKQPVTPKKPNKEQKDEKRKSPSRGKKKNRKGSIVERAPSVYRGAGASRTHVYRS